MESAVLMQPELSCDCCLRPFRLSDGGGAKLAGSREVAATNVLIPHPIRTARLNRGFKTREERRRDLSGVRHLPEKQRRSVGRHQHQDRPRVATQRWVLDRRSLLGPALHRGGRGAAEHAFRLELERVFAHHFKTNPASGRVMGELGMIAKDVCAGTFSSGATISIS